MPVDAARILRRPPAATRRADAATDARQVARGPGAAARRRMPRIEKTRIHTARRGAPRHWRGGWDEADARTRRMPRIEKTRIHTARRGAPRHWRDEWGEADARTRWMPHIEKTRMHTARFGAPRHGRGGREGADVARACRIRGGGSHSPGPIVSTYCATFTSARALGRSAGRVIFCALASRLKKSSMGVTTSWGTRTSARYISRRGSAMGA
jgi:hypothetical protein